MYSSNEILSNNTKDWDLGVILKDFISKALVTLTLTFELKIAVLNFVATRGIRVSQTFHVSPDSA